MPCSPSAFWTRQHGPALHGVAQRWSFTATGLRDGKNARAPGAARRFDCHFVTDLSAEQRAADGRVRRDAADARDLDLHALALLVLDVDGGADAPLPGRALAFVVYDAPGGP